MTMPMEADMMIRFFNIDRDIIVSGFNEPIVQV